MAEDSADSGSNIAPEPARGGTYEAGKDSGANSNESKLISALKDVIDKFSLQDKIILQGYLRKLDDGNWRLYLNPNLDEYIDIQAEAYLYHLAAGDDLLSVTYVWVKSDARVLHTVAHVAGQAAEFLEGKITREYLPVVWQTGGLASAVAGNQMFHAMGRGSIFPCGSGVNKCPSRPMCGPSYSPGPCQTSPLTLSCPTIECTYDAPCSRPLIQIFIREDSSDQKQGT